jgi:hypothetical protein
MHKVIVNKTVELFEKQISITLPKPTKKKADPSRLVEQWFLVIAVNYDDR